MGKKAKGFNWKTRNGLLRAALLCLTRKQEGYKNETAMKDAAYLIKQELKRPIWRDATTTGVKNSVNDCSMGDLARVVEASIDLLSMARFDYWLEDRDADQDPSRKEAILEMMDALAGVGLSQGSMEDDAIRIENTLRLSPQEFVARLRDQGITPAKSAPAPESPAVAPAGPTSRSK